MRLGNLIEALQQFNPDAEVFIPLYDVGGALPHIKVSNDTFREQRALVLAGYFGVPEKMNMLCDEVSHHLGFHKKVK